MLDTCPGLIKRGVLYVSSVVNVGHYRVGVYSGRY